MLIGGDETTRHTLSGGTEQLLRHPDQWERLVGDPGPAARRDRGDAALDIAGEEHVPHLTADTEFHGTALKEGEKMMLMFESANFDEKVFEDPENFNIDRNPNNHLAFGFGTHFCLGNQLARLELSIMQTKVLQRLPDHATGRRRATCRCGRPTSSAAWRRCRWCSPRPNPWAPSASLTQKLPRNRPQIRALMRHCSRRRVSAS